jgi:predicted AlkP superfamily pyrophosphatase or phosphodiesterase
VGHKYGPDSDELRVTLGEMDRHFARMLSALEAKVGVNYLLAVTADHGMPSKPLSPDHRHFAPAIIDLLHEKFDPEAKQLITSFEPENLQIFVDEDRLQYLGLTLRDLAHFLESQAVPFCGVHKRRRAPCGSRGEACDANARALEVQIESA